MTLAKRLTTRHTKVVIIEMISLSAATGNGAPERPEYYNPPGGWYVGGKDGSNHLPLTTLWF